MDGGVDRIGMIKIMLALLMDGLENRSSAPAPGSALVSTYAFLRVTSYIILYT